jgi:hypothetical protein
VAFEQRSLDDYIDVAQRIADFRERYPEGTLQAHEPWRLVQAQGTEKNGEIVQQTFIVYTAAAYRHPDDPRPGIGVAWEIFPGRTPYTRGSELMNAETSAWGRAIIAVGASDSKRGIASREEVRNRQAERDEPQQHGVLCKFLHGGPCTCYLSMPHNKDGSLSLSQLTDEQRVQAGAMSKAELREHNKLRKGDETKTARGVEIRTGPDDEAASWEGPPGELATPTAPEDSPGTADNRTKWLIAEEFTRLGAFERDQRVQWLCELTGREIKSSRELSMLEAQHALKTLKREPTPTPEEVPAGADA